MSTTEPAQEAPSDVMAEVVRLRAELARTQSAAQTLGKVVCWQAQSMEAARIEMLQSGPEKAMQWILNSIPDVDDNAPEDQWNGTETAREWLDRTEDVYRVTGLPRVTTEWCIAWGGEDANDCAGRLEYDDEAEAREMTQWIDGGTVARQTVIRLPWVNVPGETPGAGPCCTNCGPKCGCGGNPHEDQS